ncbi:MAG TPA: Ig-like domain-containing protein [Spirochaetota bacterium]|nr:Ig-like domain-containing protein [Spirochaetota bacterium]HQP47588.1 Ig-like domain-containing protein [Spirochaetota bacterium]
MKHILLYITILFSTPLLQLSCSAIADRLDFSQPEIESVSPENFATGVANTTTICVSFSKEMDTIKTNEAFSLSSSSGTVTGYFKWSDNGTKLIFTPREPLSDSLMYTISVSASAEDTEGNDLKEPLESVFYISNDLEAPSVMSHQPVCTVTGGVPDPIIPVNATIIITFSEAMDPDTLYRGFTISPPAQGHYSWNVTRTAVTFDPLYDLSPGTTYTVSLTSEITDMNSNPLPEQYTFSFTVGNDFTAPEIVSVIQDDTGLSLIEESSVSGIERNGSFTLTFNEPVKRDTLHDGVRISPSCEFHIECTAESASAKLVFDEPLGSEATYTLTLGTSISDTSGNTLERDFRYMFSITGTNSTRPRVQKITDAAGITWESGKIITLSLSSPPDYPGVTVYFSKEINPNTVNINITREVGTSGGTPETGNPDWLGKDRYMFDILHAAAGNIYKLVIRGGNNGVRDTRGNTMEEDFIQYIRF